MIQNKEFSLFCRGEMCSPASLQQILTGGQWSSLQKIIIELALFKNYLFHSEDLQEICLRVHHPSVYDETEMKQKDNI